MRKIPESSPASRPSPQFLALHPDSPLRQMLLFYRTSLSVSAGLPSRGCGGQRCFSLFFFFGVRPSAWSCCHGVRGVETTDLQIERVHKRSWNLRELLDDRERSRRGRRVSYCVREIKTAWSLLSAKLIFRVSDGQLGCFHSVLVPLGLEPPFHERETHEKRVDKTAPLNFPSP